MFSYSWFLVFLIFPITAAVWSLFYLKHKYTLREFAIQIAAQAIIIAVVLAVGSWSQVTDTEIWNGYVISKSRDHGYYKRSYSCNCQQTCSGSGDNRSCSETCDTCYEDRYTVTWSAKTTVADITFDHLDSGSRSVYQKPDPSSYVRCKEGDPVAAEKRFVNYVKGAPDSLFNTAVADQVYADRVPNYPKVYDFYRIRRVIDIDRKVDSVIIEALNDNLNYELRTLGAVKEVNIIVLLTAIPDRSFKHVVENAWLGGKKNDVVVFIGYDDTRIAWVDVMTWAKSTNNELFTATLRNKLMEEESLDADAISQTIVSTVRQHYDRPSMESFSYLKDSINPPFAVLVVGWIFSIIGTVLITIVMSGKSLSFRKILRK